MKFYSELLDRLFDSEEALKEEESKMNPPKKSKKHEPASNVHKDVVKEQEVPTKKQLADAVEAADTAVKEAYAEYETAKVRVEELSKKYLAEVNAILDPAEKAVKDAEQKRYEAIKKFNDSYGAYQVTYTGSRAADEFIKAVSNMNFKNNSILKDLFWF